jgi:hypothetical protein
VSSTTWTPRALSSEARRWDGVLWRIVETQHVAATMKLVDDQREQDVLEELLEDSKPRNLPGTAALDYLLATPFRYPPLAYGSRFRGPMDPGVFYGAESVRTASAELAYWRWRFLQDAVDLERLEPVPHTAFSVGVGTSAVDLRAPPFEAQGDLWSHPTDYAPTQAFARIVRQAEVGGIVYRSVRSPELSWCMALLVPAAFASPKPNPPRESWYLAVSQRQVTWRSERRSMRFATDPWRVP